MARDSSRAIAFPRAIAMPDEPKRPRQPRPYDVRRKPRRGVRIEPLPRSHHREFRRFVAQVNQHAQSHRATWMLARRELGDDPIVARNVTFWESVLKFMSTLEYLGTTNDTSKRP